MTESAQNQLNSIVEEYKSRNGIEPYIKLGVRKTGCAGFSHYMELITEKSDGPLIGYSRLFIEPKSILFLIGTTIDYIDEGIKEGFVFNNSENIGSCHCGKAIYR